MTPRPFLAGLLLAATAAHAQAPSAPPPPPPLPVGTHARIHAPMMPLEGLSGRLLGQRQDTILFRPDHRSYLYQLRVREIQRVDLVVARRRNTREGLAVGTLFGMG